MFGMISVKLSVPLPTKKEDNKRSWYCGVLALVSHCGGKQVTKWRLRHSPPSERKCKEP